MSIGKVLYSAVLVSIPEDWKVVITSVEYTNKPEGFTFDLPMPAVSLPLTVEAQSAIVYTDIQADDSFHDEGLTCSGNVLLTVTDNEGTSKNVFITASTDEWGLVERCENIVCVFGLVGSAPGPVLYSGVTDLRNPSGFTIGFGKDSSGKFTMVGSSNPNNPVDDAMIAGVLDGSIKLIEDALSFVFF